MIEIRHGASSGAAAGRGVRAALETSAMIRNAAQREEAFQLDQEIARTGLELSRQDAEMRQRVFQQGQEDRTFGRMVQLEELAFRRGDRADRADMRGIQRESMQLERDALEARMQRDDRAFELDSKGAAIQQEAAELDLELRRLGVDQAKAAQAFTRMRRAGLPPVQAKQALEAAGQIMGGGFAQGLSVLADMSEEREAVFARMAPEHQQRFILEEADQQRQQQMQAARMDVGDEAAFLAELAILSPEKAQEFARRAAEGSDEEVAGAVAELRSLKQTAHAKNVREVQRADLTQTMATKRAEMAEKVAGIEEFGQDLSPFTRDLQGRVQALDALMEELRLDKAPDIDAYQEGFRALARGLTADQGGTGEPSLLNREDADLLLRGGPNAGPPVERFDVWASELAGPGEIELAVSRMAQIQGGDMSDSEKAEEVVRFLGDQFPFSPDDPGFLKLVREKMSADARTARQAKREARRQAQILPSGIDRSASGIKF